MTLGTSSDGSVPAAASGPLAGSLPVRDRFERDGFVVLEGFVPQANCQQLIDYVEEHLDEWSDWGAQRSIFSTNEQTRTSDEYFLSSGESIRAFYESESFDADGNLTVEPHLAINKLGHAMHDVDPMFRAFSRTAELAELADALGVGHHVLWQSMYIFKQPLIGGEVNNHCDHTFLWTEPRSVTGFWFALQDATIENGCLWAVPGGHTQPADRRFRRAVAGDDAAGTTMETFGEYPDEPGVALEVEAGTLIVLHGQLPHRSEANRSDRSRHAYTLHTIDPSAEYPADNWLQRPTLAASGFRG